jgi:hypothetical protein
VVANTENSATISVDVTPKFNGRVPDDHIQHFIVPRFDRHPLKKAENCVPLYDHIAFHADLSSVTLFHDQGRRSLFAQSLMNADRSRRLIKPLNSMTSDIMLTRDEEEEEEEEQVSDRSQFLFPVEYQRQLDAALGENMTLKMTLESIFSRLKGITSASNQSAELAGTIMSQQAEISNLHHDNERLRAELEDLHRREASETSADDFAALRRESVALRAELQQLRSEDASPELESLRRENDALRERIAALEAQPEGSPPFSVEDVQFMVARLEAFAGEKESLNATIERLHAEAHDREAVLRLLLVRLKASNTETALAAIDRLQSDQDQLLESGDGGDPAERPAIELMARLQVAEEELAKRNAAQEDIDSVIQRAVAAQKRQLHAMDAILRKVEHRHRDALAMIERIERSLSEIFGRLGEPGRAVRGRLPRATGAPSSPAGRRQGIPGPSGAAGSPARAQTRPAQGRLHPDVAAVLKSLEDTVRGHRSQLHEDHVELVSALSNERTGTG